MSDFEEEFLSENPTIESLTALISAENVANLSYDFGGRLLYFPRKIGSNHPIAVSIGIVYAKKICQVYGGNHFSVPLRAGKELAIRNLREKKLSVSAIAREMKCSRTYVKTVISAGEDKNQMKLF